MHFCLFFILCIAGCTEATEASEECVTNADCAADEICELPDTGV